MNAFAGEVVVTGTSAGSGAALASPIAVALAGRKRGLVIAAKARCGMWPKLVGPALFDRMAREAL